jgi:ABC-type lipoprotein release transport system permease subunit
MTILWLVLREIARQRRALLGPLIVMASAIALCVGIELVSRAREAAIGAQIDRAAAPLRMTVTGLSATELARLEPGRRFLPHDLLERVRILLGASARAVQGRLILRLAVAGEDVPLIGVERDDTAMREALGGLQDGQIALGAGLSDRLGVLRGQSVQFGSTRAEVGLVLPPSGSIEDFAAFSTLATAQAISGSPAVLNEILIFPVMGQSLDRLERSLRTAFSDAAVHRTDRGLVADQETGEALKGHRATVYGVMALAAALCLLVVVQVHTAERRLELATLGAMGIGAPLLLLLVTWRAVIVGVGGALLGILAASAVALARDFESASAVLPAWSLFGLTFAAAMALSAVAAAPAALLAARRDPATVLKDL